MTKSEWRVERVMPSAKYYPVRTVRKLFSKHTYLEIFGDGYYNRRICVIITRRLNNGELKRWKRK